ncbi:hypothetical protein AOQ84DRAFT_325915 [Glonium stellatum]|uniref:Uncharacterized protein n=1 Tax=Glonium stellatum TaxID=574774 RepID=A0A8E2JNC0_9PEZI|nr:hypothetical protein AOQ84DRAFT_325915 [Glonium stellatum]
MSFLVKLAGTGIGLAAEAHAHRKESKSRAISPAPGPTTISSIATGRELDASQNYEDAPPVYAELPADQASELIAAGRAVPAEQRQEDDEEAWQLDDAVEEADPQAYAEVSDKDVKAELMCVLVRLPPPNLAYRLPCPVILPQRRPRAKARGFVRAYAPVLEGCGIDQDGFLVFLNTFDKASEASKILDVIFLGAVIAGMVPSVTAMITSTVIQVAVGAAKEVQSRKRANSFLDDMNEKLFQPRGLYCLVMAFKPDAERPVTTGQVNIGNLIAKYSQPAESKVKDTMSKLRVSSGKTYGELEMPEAAPLIFPALDQMAAGADGKKPNKLQRGSEFVANYMDRRAQANYQHEHPNSALSTTPKPKFASRYSDPNHPANSGSLLALVTGGRMQGLHGQPGGGRGMGIGGLGALRGGLFGRGVGNQSYGNQYQNTQYYGNQDYGNENYDNQNYHNQNYQNQDYNNQNSNNQNYNDPRYNGSMQGGMGREYGIEMGRGFRRRPEEVG